MACLLLAAICLALASTAVHGQLRVMDYNIAQLRGNTNALQNVLIAAHADDKPGFAVPVSIFVFEEVRSADLAALTSIVNAAAPPGVSYVLGTFTTSVNEDQASGASAIYYRSGMLTENAALHVDFSTGGGRNTDRWQLRLAGYNSPFSWLYVYGSHLKSDTGSANQTERLNGVIAIRNNADALGAGLHVLYCGDMNFYNNNEPGYLQFFAAGNGQAVDPLGTGSWAGGLNPPNNVNNYKHTQSPLAAAVGGLVGGGMDDRFDFQLPNIALSDGEGLSIIPATYRALGNDGLHYSQAIDNNVNFYYPGDVPRSNALATNLRLASDHLPVLVDYQIPAMMAASMPANYGRVIVGTAFSVTVNVTNPANVTFDLGADVLSYSATGSIGLSGTITGTVEPLGDVDMIDFPLNTSTAAVRNGTVTLSSSSQGVQPTSLVLNTTGTVVRKSNPSFSNAAVMTAQTLPLNYDANTGVKQFSVNVYNVGFDSLQATLDLDSVNGVSPPFGYVSGLTSGIGSTAATVTFSFNTDGAAPGMYSAPIVIQTSDEDIPGEQSTSLNLTVNVAINGSLPCPADINHDGLVNVSDLLAVINGWGACTCAADINGDGLVNVSDLLAVINAWGVCQ